MELTSASAFRYTFFMLSTFLTIRSVTPQHGKLFRILSSLLAIREMLDSHFKCDTEFLSEGLDCGRRPL